MRFKITRSFYLTGKEEEIKDEEANAVAYLFPLIGNSRWAAMGFGGKRQRPDFDNSFRDRDAALAHIQNYFKNLREVTQYKADLRKKEHEFQTTLKVGDILYTSWGYDQTNVDFYQVVEVKSGKTVVIKEIAPDTYGEWSGHCSPVPDKFVGEPLVKRVRKGDVITIDNVKSAYKWDSKPKYYSTYA